MSSKKNQFSFIAMHLVLATLLGLALPGITLAEVECTNANTKTASVVAIDHTVMHNRMGAVNVDGMIYALRRDVVDDNVPPNPIGNEGQAAAELLDNVANSPFQLRPGKRPRPLVLRMNEGDCLQIRFQNLLNDTPHVAPSDFGEQPATRSAGIHASGLSVVDNIQSDGTFVGTNTGGPSNLNGLVDPGDAITYTLYAPFGSEGIHLFTSTPVIGGEGDGASVALGLFGSINVEPPGAEYYRSQLTHQELEWSLDKSNASLKDADFDGRYDSSNHPIINYDATYPVAAGDLAGLPIISILQGNEIVHSDLRAIITGPGRGDFGAPGSIYPPNPALAPNASNVPGGGPQAPGAKLDRPREEPFREFSIFFHDEQFAIQAFEEFEDPVLNHTLHCCRDAFGINYGIGGIGSEILANRFGVGPQWDCVECKYEEFFLTSWVLGDPAMNSDLTAGQAHLLPPDLAGGPQIATTSFFPDDPSNVEHSYIGDHVKMRNVHAGPKEHHIFHLHSHQWLFTPDKDQSAYLDSQAIGPGSHYNYDIAYNGSGNRNQTPGDAIYHCHFYPHFAQGMWALWRNHDVFEEGTEMELDPGTGMPFDITGFPTTPVAGARALPDGEIVAGTPIPAVVPIPTLAMAPMPHPVQVLPVARPQFGGRLIGSNIDTTPWDAVDTTDTTLNPGYPFFIAATIGHRPPDPVLDHAVISGVIQDGGLHDPNNPNNARHVVLNGTVGDMFTTRLDMRKITATIEPKWYPEDGTNLEKVAMEYHAERTHASITPSGDPLNYVTNGLGPVSGAPYADPCVDDFGNDVGHWDIGEAKTPGNNNFVVNSFITGTNPNNTTPARLYKAADIELDIVFNKLGEHFPQSRMIALWEDVGDFVSQTRAPEPLFFRANSRECIEYWQTNLIPHEYQLDDFQVRTPTDIIGQHIHLVKFDVTSADGSANGWNYEDASFSPGEVIERIEAIHHYCDLQLPAVPAVCVNIENLQPVQHPFFGGPEALGATTVIQRWYADETMSMTGIDRTLRTVYTHDHYGPSTHQQVSLYAGLLIEPEDSEWFDMVTGAQMGGRGDGGPTSWRANIHTNLDAFGNDDSTDQSLSYREFMFEFADFALGYKPGVLGQAKDDLNQDVLPQPNFVNRALAINPPAKATIGLPFVLEKAALCPGDAAPPCPEGVSADDPGSFVVNYRNESVLHRVHQPNPQPNPDVDADPGDGLAFGADPNDIDHNGDGILNASDTESNDCLNPLDFSKTDADGRKINGCQAAGLAGDMGHVFRSDVTRAIPELNTALGNSPYPPLTGGVRPGDPFTPLMQAYENDRVQFRFMVGAHEEGHVESIWGVNWLFEPNAKDSGWRNAQMAGISEHFEFELENLSPVKGDAPFADYLYNFDTSSDGAGTGVWGLVRTYQGPDSLEPVDGNLETLPNNPTGKSPGRNDIDPDKSFAGVCPKEFIGNGKNKVPNPEFKGERKYSVTAVRAADVLPVVPSVGAATLVYNSRKGAFPHHEGPLHDPNALMYVFTNDLQNGKLKAGVPVEPLVLRAAAGECIFITLYNALPEEGVADDDAFNVVPMVIERFNLNEVHVSSEVGLHPQLVKYDVITDEGANVGLNVSNFGKRTVSPGEVHTYKMYAGDIRVIDGDMKATPIEYGATNLVAPDPVEHSAKGLIGSLIIEPLGSTWKTDQERCYPMATGKGKKGGAPDPDADCFESGEIPYRNSRSAATIYDGYGNVLFREMVLQFQDDIQYRDKYGNAVCPIAGAEEEEGGAHGPFDPEEQFECGGPEDPEDSGLKAVNYRTEPAWFRKGIDPGAPFGHTRQIDYTDLLSNSVTKTDGVTPSIDLLAGEDPDPQTPILVAKKGQEVRFRVLQSGGHPRNHVFAMHGHIWQKSPYVTTTEDNPLTAGIDESSIGSETIGNNIKSEYYGTQAGHGPQNHHDMVLKSAGGADQVTGDFLWRNQATFQFDAGHWGLLRVID